MGLVGGTRKAWGGFREALASLYAPGRLPGSQDENFKKVIKVKKVKKCALREAPGSPGEAAGTCGRPQEGGRLLGGPSTPLPGRKFKKVIKVVKVIKIKS